MVTEKYRKRGGGFKMVNAEDKQRTNTRTRKAPKEQTEAKGRIPQTVI